MLKSKKIFLSFLVVFVMVFSFSSKSLAKEEENKSGIAVNPSIINLTAEEGEIISSSFKYFNNTEFEQSINLEISPYILSNQTSGSPIFNNEDGSPIDSDSKKWFELKSLDSKTIKPGEYKNIEFTISVPKKTEAKKYYNAIFVNSSSEGKEDKGSGNLISYRMGVLTILEVQDKVTGIAKYIKAIKDSPATLILIILALIALALSLVKIVKKRKDLNMVFEEKDIIETKKENKKTNKKK
uniref:DUF916 domain-containing protein n=1 Tax=candidate division CPR3 bacterium TaxID=2268181 RepID=A0A7C4M0H0_UNCC3